MYLGAQILTLVMFIRWQGKVFARNHVHLLIGQIKQLSYVSSIANGGLLATLSAQDHV